MKRCRSGFTLIEILVVIAILAIISAGAVSVANNVVKKAKINKTKAAIANLVSALEEYYRETKSYPNNLFADLTSHPKTSPIIDKLADDFKKSDDVNNPPFIDSWSKTMKYQNRGNGNFPKITSAGPDKVFDTADDIVSTDQ